MQNCSEWLFPRHDMVDVHQWGPSCGFDRLDLSWIKGKSIAELRKKCNSVSKTPGFWNVNFEQTNEEKTQQGKIVTWDIKKESKMRYEKEKRWEKKWKWNPWDGKIRECRQGPMDGKLMRQVLETETTRLRPDITRMPTPDIYRKEILAGRKSQ